MLRQAWLGGFRVLLLRQSQAQLSVPIVGTRELSALSRSRFEAQPSKLMPNVIGNIPKHLLAASLGPGLLACGAEPRLPIWRSFSAAAAARAAPPQPGSTRASGIESSTVANSVKAQPAAQAKSAPKPGGRKQTHGASKSKSAATRTKTAAPGKAKANASGTLPRKRAATGSTAASRQKATKAAAKAREKAKAQKERFKANEQKEKAKLRALKEKEEKKKARMKALEQKEKEKLGRLKEKEKVRLAKLKAKHRDVLEKARAKKAARIKRAPNAYALFVKDQSKAIAATLPPGSPVPVLAKAYSQRYKELSAEEKRKYEEEAATAKAENDKLRKERKEQRAATTVLSPFLRFADELRKSVRTANPDMSTQDQAKKLGEMWQALSPEEKEKYLDATQAEKRAKGLLPSASAAAQGGKP